MVFKSSGGKGGSFRISDGQHAVQRVGNDRLDEILRTVFAKKSEARIRVLYGST